MSACLSRFYICKYAKQKCSGYSDSSWTCRTGGGEYCGTFRTFENQRLNLEAPKIG